MSTREMTKSPTSYDRGYRAGFRDGLSAPSLLIPDGREFDSTWWAELRRPLSDDEFDSGWNAALEAAEAIDRSFPCTFRRGYEPECGRSASHPIHPRSDERMGPGRHVYRWRREDVEDLPKTDRFGTLSGSDRDSLTRASQEHIAEDQRIAEDEGAVWTDEDEARAVASLASIEAEVASR